MGRAPGVNAARAGPHTLARLAAALGGRLPARGQRIGLLGGSFNPPHRGHVEISLTALRRLRLDAVWWLVSPQNPLKSRTQTAALERRLAAARSAARHPRIVVTAIEAALGTVYTADTVAVLVRRFPGVRFVWLMGADNLVQISQWRNWPQIFATVAVAVFDRPSYSLRASAAKAARRFASHRVPEAAARELAGRAPPAWVFIHQRLNPQSSTRIRTAGGSGTAAKARRPARQRLTRKTEKTRHITQKQGL